GLFAWLYPFLFRTDVAFSFCCRPGSFIGMLSLLNTFLPALFLPQDDAYRGAGLGGAVKVKSEVAVEHRQAFVNVFQADAVALGFDGKGADGGQALGRHGS